MTALTSALAVLAALTTRSAGRVTRSARSAREAGASALEFAIIAAIVVVAASVIGGVIYNIVDTKSQKLDQCANQPVGGAACAP